MVLIYALTIFLSAFLLFQVELVIAKHILPWFGGTPAVWTTCMLFFQVLLMAGYAYSHLIVKRLRSSRQARLHVAILAASLCVLGVQALLWSSPVLPGDAWKPDGSDYPVLRILGLLGVAIGLPFFILSTTSSLLQAWFARTNPGRSPYRLYALSNAGSMLALVSYPFVVEPNLTLGLQADTWAAGYVVFALGCAVCGLVAGRVESNVVEAGPDPPEPDDPPADGGAGPGAADRLLWVALPAIPSVLLLGTTNHISEEIAVVPFLWVMPLCAYLASFIICFDRPRWYVRPVFVVSFLLGLGVAASLGLDYLLDLGWTENVEETIEVVVGKGGGLHRGIAATVLLFVACMLGHGELVRRKPEPRYLTAFYLSVSVGGALGGVFVAVVAPSVFSGLWELPLGYAACWALVILTTLGDRRSWMNGRWRWAWRPAAGLVLLGLIALPLALLGRSRDQAVVQRRNFYGIFRVEERDAYRREGRRRTLYHGATAHGTQFLHPDHRDLTTTYYTESSGVGLAVRNHPRRTEGDGGFRLGVVGLGAGTLAAYGRPGDYVRFYEINPAIIELAAGPKSLFSFIDDSPARIDIVPGDARISLERELEDAHEQRFDVLALDAFSGDTPPLHLLTREAFETYLAHLREGGVLAVHVSNRYLDLAPAVWRLADEFGLHGAMIDTDTDDEDNRIWGASWMLLTHDAELLQLEEIAEATEPKGETARPVRLWTDDYSNLFQALR